MTIVWGKRKFLSCYSRQTADIFGVAFPYQWTGSISFDWSVSLSVVPQRHFCIFLYSFVIFFSFFFKKSSIFAASLLLDVIFFVFIGFWNHWKYIKRTVCFSNSVLLEICVFFSFGSHLLLNYLGSRYQRSFT